jgi:uncharacterized protein (UPF0276 family)
MQLAINYSPQAAQLYRSGAIQLDRFKLPNWDWLIDEARQVAPVYVHFDLIAGDGRLAGRDWAAIERQMRDTGTRFLNLHLFSKLAHFGWDEQPRGANRLHAVETMIRDVALACRRMGAENVIVENIPLKAKDRPVEATADPQVIADVLKATGAGLLLDVSHARLTCEFHGWSFTEYLRALPLERTGEVHVTGITTMNGDRRDHFGFSNEDWPFVDEALASLSARGARPHLLAFEYGGVGERFEWRSDPVVIARDMPLLAARVKALTQP